MKDVEGALGAVMVWLGASAAVVLIAMVIGWLKAVFGV